MTMVFRTFNIRYFMAVYTGTLLAWGSFHFGKFEYFLSGISIVILYAVLDLVWTRIRDGVWYVPLSSFISGFILALIASPAPGLIFIILLPLAAVFSKQVIKSEGRHIFNPAAFSAVLFGASWWGASWGSEVLAVIIATGLVIISRQRRWESIIAFFAMYAFLSAILFAAEGKTAGEIFSLLKPRLLDGTTIFFATVMLIEPLTTSFSGTKRRVLFACLVAALAVILSTGAFSFGVVTVDPLLGGLLIGNAVMTFASRRRSGILSAV